MADMKPKANPALAALLDSLDDPDDDVMTPLLQDRAEAKHPCCNAPIEGPHMHFCAHSMPKAALRKGLDLYAASKDANDIAGLADLRNDRTALLRSLDPAALRKAGFGDMDDDTLLAACHLARVHCEELTEQERAFSERWLRDPKKRLWLIERGLYWDTTQILPPLNS
jgi:hypothetical protein